MITIIHILIHSQPPHTQAGGIPQTLIDSWRHCGLKVQGCWTIVSDENRFRNLTYWMLLTCRSVPSDANPPRHRPHRPCGPDSSRQTTQALVLRTRHPRDACPLRCPHRPGVRRGNTSTCHVGAFTHHQAMDELHALLGTETDGATPPTRSRHDLRPGPVGLHREGLRSDAIAMANIRPGWIDTLVKAASSSCADADFGVDDLVRLAGAVMRIPVGRCVAARTRHQPCSASSWNKAAHLIRTTPGIPTVDIVDRCGFANDRVFLRQFRDDRHDAHRRAEDCTSGVAAIAQVVAAQRILPMRNRPFSTAGVTGLPRGEADCWLNAIRGDGRNVPADH